MYGNKLKINVNKEELLKTLKENRSKHESDLAKAKIGFRKLLVIELEKKLQAAKSGRKVELHFKNQKPASYLNEYDDVIGMLEVSTDTELELDYDQYKQYVQDNWSWKGTWSLSNSAYILSAEG